MSRIAYVNGSYVPFQDAGVHIEDRGYQFADGVYEVIYFENGRLIDAEGHLNRLDRSLGLVRIAQPMSRAALLVVIRRMICLNRLPSGILYIQVTRGVSRRDHPFPKDVPPSLVMTVRRAAPPSEDMAQKGVSVITIPDQRWARCDIKTIGLLPNLLGKQTAKEQGAYEAWMVDRDGFVTEGTSTNAWIVTKEGRLVTRNAEPAILNGITRRTLLRLAETLGLTLEERSFTVAEAKVAAEAFLSSTTGYALPVVSIDGQPVGDGKAGQVTWKLRQAYRRAMQEGEI